MDFNRGGIQAHGLDADAHDLLVLQLLEDLMLGDIEQSVEQLQVLQLYVTALPGKTGCNAHPAPRSWTSGSCGCRWYASWRQNREPAVWKVLCSQNRESSRKIADNPAIPRGTSVLPMLVSDLQNSVRN